MQYRRFGRTGLDVSVFSLGGMRLPRGWDNDLSLASLTREEKAQIREITDRSFDLGINHVETARGYTNSEEWLRFALEDRPRDRYLLQTKATPRADPREFEETLETSMRTLQADYLDFFSFHGINEQQELAWTLQRGGCMEVARRWQKEGRIRHLGFSSHGACEVIVDAIATGEFDYVNLHWYFINQTNWPAIEAAAAQDMGVFIISPTDKGGQLFKPTVKLRAVCAPLHPITFNDLFCLRRPEVHTLSLGAGRVSDFDEHLAALEFYDRIDETIRPLEDRFHTAMKEALGADWWPDYTAGLPWYRDVPGEVNLLYILRLWSLAQGMDMIDYGKYRYGMIEGGRGGNWMGGAPAVDFDEAALRETLRDHPHRDRIPGILREAHALLQGAKRGRLSED